MKRLRSVLAVCRAGSTAQAAALLPLSQSAIARAVRQLEAQLGIPVFERGARGMLPTREGRILAHRADRALTQLEQAEAEASRLSDEAASSSSSSARALKGRFAGACSYRHLAAYIAFCETRSESAAARRLKVSQPAISQALRQVEYMLGTSLFERLTRGMRLTESGEAVLRRAKLALNELRLADEDLSEVHGRTRGRIVVGSLPLSAGVLVPRAVDRMLANHGDLHVTVVDGTYDALLNQLLHADVDVIVGALRTAQVSPHIVQMPLFADTLSVVARHGHPLLHRPLRGLRDLAAASWIAPLTGTPARDAFERAFAADGVPAPEGPLEANSAVVVQALLQDSDRLALLSRRQVLRGMAAGLLDVIPVEVKETTREIGLALRKDADPGVGLRLFMEEMRSLVEDEYISDTHS
ncbi:LysR family transcriptional regulator [Pusillimonas sp.]|uniref:LysR family transcriptional regulator n=1 Tax=Pusillimonas sp. TaxID=3040095 RepID=UPI0037C94E0E